jgi:ribosomal RNA-processing protein 8
MFSVPGWNVSASLATQVEKPKAPKPNKKDKKKQQKQKQEEQVNEANVGAMWDKVIEGKVPSAPVKKVKEQQVVPNEGVPAGDGADEKKGKKRKRGTRGEGRGPSGSKGDIKVAATADAPQDQAKPAKNDEPKRDKKKQKKEHKADQSSKPQTTADATLPPAAILESLLPPEPKGLTPLQKSMRQKLAGARFRHLNETLYTKPSTDSLALFKEDPSMFEDYHRGFAMQTEGWPENPVDGYVDAILTRGKLRDQSALKDNKRNEPKPRYRDPTKPEVEAPTTAGGPKPLPRNLKGHCTVADLGCGTASLSYRMQPHLKSLNMHIDSYDLSKPSGPSAPLVRIADVSALPCAEASVDVAVFCLALMGTNWLDFIDEAYRILRWRGELWIAEIKSRFGRVEKAKGGKGKPPINSIGSLRKGGPKPAKKQDERGDGGELDSADEAELATRIDGAAAKEGTDVSSFIAVLRAHGFVLDAPQERPSAAIDLGNKMFVKMQFVKAAQPTKGKNVKASVNGLKMGMKGKKFTAVEDDDPDDAENAKVLKPCLYKIR